MIHPEAVGVLINLSTIDEEKIINFNIEENNDNDEELHDDNDEGKLIIDDEKLHDDDDDDINNKQSSIINEKSEINKKKIDIREIVDLEKPLIITKQSISNNNLMIKKKLTPEKN